MVDLVGIEPTTSSMRWKRAPSCATGPLLREGKRPDSGHLKYFLPPAWLSQTSSLQLPRSLLTVDGCYERESGVQRGSISTACFAILKLPLRFCLDPVMLPHPVGCAEVVKLADTPS